MRPRGPVERAVRDHVRVGDRLATPARGAAFSVGAIDAERLTLLLGKNEARTPITWQCIEGVADFLRGKGWVEIGSRFDVQGDPATLDGYLKLYVNRAVAAWVAAVFERARVVEIELTRPARVRLRPEF